MRGFTNKYAALLGAALLLVSYLIYQQHAEQVQAVLGSKLPLRQPFENVPLNLGNWLGTDSPLDEAVIRVAGADYHVNRVYRNPRLGEVTSVYACYYGHPRTMVGHYPEVCYRAVGWRLLGHNEVVLPIEDIADNDDGIPVDIHHFERGSERVTVISFFIVGGRYTNDRNLAERAAHRAIDIENRNYLAQVQMSLLGTQPIDRTVRIATDFLARFLPHVNECLPDTSTVRIVSSEESSTDGE